MAPLDNTHNFAELSSVIGVPENLVSAFVADTRKINDVLRLIDVRTTNSLDNKLTTREFGRPTIYKVSEGQRKPVTKVPVTGGSKPIDIVKFVATMIFTDDEREELAEDPTDQLVQRLQDEYSNVLAAEVLGLYDGAPYASDFNATLEGAAGIRELAIDINEAGRAAAGAGLRNLAADSKRLLRGDKIRNISALVHPNFDYLAETSTRQSDNTDLVYGSLGEAFGMNPANIGLSEELFDPSDPATPVGATIGYIGDFKAAYKMLVRKDLETKYSEDTVVQDGDGNLHLLWQDNEFAVLTELKAGGTVDSDSALIRVVKA